MLSKCVGDLQIAGHKEHVDNFFGHMDRVFGKMSRGTSATSPTVMSTDSAAPTARRRPART
eukprot:5305848-Pyramimonas_sp.AAC.1